MTPEFYDIQDLLDLIKELESRINKLEHHNSLILRRYETADSYYWNHG